MFISLEWIAQYVDLSDLPDPADRSGSSALTPEALALRLTMATAEVEGVTRIDRSTHGVVAADLISVEDIPGAPGLKWVEVDCGTGLYRTVCGAPNTRVGLRAAFAPPGARIAAGHRVEAAEVAGRQSQGILCSAKELGLSQFHEVLFEIPQSVPKGASISDLIPPFDAIIEIDNKSLTHRPDLWGHYGVAREVAAILGRPLRPLPMQDLSVYDRLPAYPLEVRDFDGCPAYCCMEMDRIALGPAPLAMQWRLHAVGQRTIDLLVDLTNYIAFDLAQPMHAFDGGKLKAVNVAPMGREDPFVTLDGQTRAMLPDDLMIWNEKDPVAIAGVMGGRDTEVTPQTTRLMLESANFRGSRIRRTAVRLGLRSEASLRFEKNQPPINAKLAVGRFLHLLGEAGQRPEILSRLTVAGDLKENPRPLAMPIQYFHNRIGMRIPDDRICGILHSLGFGARIEDGQRLCVDIPPFRSAYDISIPPDIVEEVARVHGFDNIQPAMPAVRMGAVKANSRLRAEHKARRLLAQAHEFTEVHSYGWFDDRWLAAIGFDPGPALTLTNPSAEGQSRLRTTLMPNLLADVKLNFVHRDRFRLFELGRVFQPQGETGCRESTHLAAVSYRQAKTSDLETHFLEMKGAVEDLAAMIGCGEWAFEPAENRAAPWRQSGACVSLRLGERTVGHLGHLSGPILEELGPNPQVCWFELDFDALAGPDFPQVAYQPPSMYPYSWFDVSIVWDHSAGYRTLEQKLDAFSHPLIVKREFLVSYRGAGLDKGKASYSFRYWLGSTERTLTGEEIESCHASCLAFLRAERLSLR